MKKLIALLLINIMYISIGLADTARDIMQKVDDRDDGQSQYSKQTLATCKYQIVNKRIRCSETPRVKVVEALNKDFGTHGKDSKSLMVILDPPSERGISFLQYDWDAQGKDTDQWMFLSAMNKVKRIVSGNENEPKTGSLFGSEFSYEDVEQTHLDDYTYSIKQETSYQNRPVWIIESQPTPQRARKSNYSKSIQWIDKERYVPLKALLYNRRGKIIKQMTFSDYTQKDDIWVAQKMNMNNKETQRITTMKMENITLNIGIEDDIFTQRALTDKAFQQSQLQDLRPK